MGGAHQREGDTHSIGGGCGWLEGAGCGVAGCCLLEARMSCAWYMMLLQQLSGLWCMPHPPYSPVVTERVLRSVLRCHC